MSTATARDFDVLIIGGGVIGCTMARLLVVRGLCAAGRVAVIADRLAPLRAAPEQGVAAQAVAARGVAQGVPLQGPPEADWDLRVFALSRSSQRLLELCGIWASIPKDKMGAYARMCVWDARGEPKGSGSLTFDCAELGEPDLGFIVEGRALQLECVAAAPAAGAVFIEATIDEVTIGRDGVDVRLMDGRRLGGQLLMAADGTESKARGLLGFETAGHAYHQDALVAHVRTVKSHRGTAWQRFRATGPLALLPLPDGRSSIVWTVPRGETRHLCSLGASAFGEQVTAASGGVLGACELTTAVAAFPLKLQYALNYVRPRAVLLGDAAHIVHPLAGQGLNQGLLDCAVMAEVLSGEAEPSSGAPGRAAFYGEHRILRRYERRRRSDNLAVATALDGLERLFSHESLAVARLRGLGLGLVDRLPFVKRRFAERAMGLAGDIPQFLTGQSG